MKKKTKLDCAILLFGIMLLVLSGCKQEANETYFNYEISGDINQAIERDKSDDYYESVSFSRWEHAEGTSNQTKVNIDFNIDINKDSVHFYEITLRFNMWNEFLSEKEYEIIKKPLDWEEELDSVGVFFSALEYLTWEVDPVSKTGLTQEFRYNLSSVGKLNILEISSELIRGEFEIVFDLVDGHITEMTPPYDSNQLTPKEESLIIVGSFSMDNKYRNPEINQ